MRRIKIIGAAITAVVALSAIAAVSASALPEFSVPGGFPIEFTSHGGAGKLQFRGGNTIECADFTNKGTLTNATTMTVTIDFLSCKLFSIINAHSLGDAAGTILVTATGSLCYLNKANKEVGLRLTATGKVHIEASTSLAIVEGTVIGLLTPVNRSTLGPFILSLKQTGGVQAITKCEGGATEHLEGQENEVSPNKEAGEEASPDEINFLREAVELMA